MFRTRLLGAVLVGAVLMAAGCGATEPGGPSSDTSGAVRAEPGAGAAGGGSGPERPVPAGEWRTAGCAADRSPRTVATGGAAMPVTPPELAAVMGRIESVGRSRFPDSYAGLEVDEPGVRTIVYRVPSAEFDGFVRENAGDVCVVVRDAAHSARRLAALQDRITADLDRWASDGLRINAVGARHDGTGVEVGVEDVARARVELTARYGADAPVIVVEQGPLVPLPWTGPRPAG